jgi:peptidyl-prolyl cis-trans isomerase C
MNSYRIALLALLLTGFIAAGCQQKPATQGKAVAVVNGQTITDAEFQQYLRLRQQREPVTDATQKKKALDEMIDRVLIAQRAEANGLDKDPEVQNLMRRVRENILVQSMIRKTLEDNPITDEQLKQRFQTEVAATHKTEYLVSHILTKDEDEAKDIIKQLKNKKADFATLAKKKSIDVQSGKNGGSLGWINEGMVVPEFFKGVAGLKKGDISSEPVKSDFGWHIIKLEDTRAAKIPTFEEFMADPKASANFRRTLQDEKIENMMKQLRADAKIEYKNETGDNKEKTE